MAERHTDKMAQARIRVRLQQVRSGNFGDRASVGSGVLELRIHIGPGYRVYFGRQGQLIVILLCGGNKSTQATDIKRAKAFWLEWKGRK
jgi:putative addiction module killer protein